MRIKPEARLNRLAHYANRRAYLSSRALHRHPAPKALRSASQADIDL
ncbi:MAG: hypothetical protein AB8E87_09800 [Prochlorococcus sp.]